MLYVDQWGHHVLASTVVELRSKLGGGRVSRMYVYKKDGRAVHIGYVVGCHWCRAYKPVELPA